MLTDTKTVINALVVVLFLTMIVLSPNMLDLSLFLVLFYFSYSLR